MNQISLLNQETIDKIAAGEVVERPASVVKELVENSVDSRANSVTVEIRNGGISLIRVTDNGCGIPADEVRSAFLRHTTSKIRSIDDIMTSGTLGFRGEALSSIAAVSQMEMITKTPDGLLGVRYVTEGGKEISLEEIGAPEGTTLLVHNLFYHTPARRKFLKSETTEAGYVSDLMDRLALSHPDISFKFINNNDTKLHTSGNGKIKDIIYNIFGREIASEIVEIDTDTDNTSVHIRGYIGKPSVSRGNRNYENYFVNGRYVHNAVITRAIEDAYKPFLMNHRFPFTALMIDVDPALVDVNVHPAKMEVRFADQNLVYKQVFSAVSEGLVHRELIPEFSVDNNKSSALDARASDATASPDDAKPSHIRYPEPFEKVRSQLVSDTPGDYEPKYPGHPSHYAVLNENRKDERQLTPVTGMVAANPVQEELFDDTLLSEQNISRHRLVGQIFGTYWIVEFQDKMYIIDQHAAHEKVLYERFMKNLAEKKQTSQMIAPPIIVSLSIQEEEMLTKHMERFTEVGFEIEPFGGREYSINAVPGNLYGIAEGTLFMEILDGLTDIPEKASDEAVREKIASMSCKAAVKGNHTMQPQEADALISELLSLDNPYNCPHGRPTIISMSKYELEKKFKRIL